MEEGMKASVVDLRYRMKDVLRALRMNEEVEILYHGKVAGRIIPVNKASKYSSVSEHPFFGMSRVSKSRKAVLRVMHKLRASRYHAL